MSPTGRSVLLISRRLLVLGLFCSCPNTLLDIEAHTMSLLMGKFWVEELTEDIVQSLSGWLLNHKLGPIASLCTWS